MINKVSDYIIQNKMIEKGDRVVVGVSGGADSVCLLYILKELFASDEVKLIAVHVNHGIRGEEADQDEQFVKELCLSWGIDYYPFIYDVKKLAAAEGLSQEEAGRRARYQSFTKVCRLLGCNRIAVAHNKNDNAETILFHLFRGTGIKGMTGIEPTRRITVGAGDITAEKEDAVSGAGDIDVESWAASGPGDNVAESGDVDGSYGELTLIRPLLCAERIEIEDYLKQEGITYRTDSSNLTDDYSRNKIRNKILSYAAAEINSRAVSNINESALKLREAFEYVNQEVLSRFPALVKQEGAVWRIAAEGLLREPAVIQKEILRRMLELLAGNLKDLESGHIDLVLALCGKPVGKQVHLPCRVVAEREYNDIKIYVKNEDYRESLTIDTIEPIKIIIPGRVIIPGIDKILETELIPYKNNEPVPKSSCIKWFDYDKIENAVEARYRKEGDYIQINASGGNKKLKSYFIDRKIPKKQRDCQLLIADGSHIMWIPGAADRISEKYKVGETTSKVLLMKLIDLEGSYSGR